MNKKFLIGLAPLLVTAAFVVMPAVSQGFETCTAPACPHIYRNGSVTPEKTKVRGIAWATLKLFNEKLGTVECHNVFAGIGENPTGNGAAIGKVQAFYPYECNDPTCAAKLGKIIVEPRTMPWKTVAEQAKPNEFWGKVGFKGPTPGKEPSEETEPEFIQFFSKCTGVVEANFYGENNSLVQNNGVSIGAIPAEVQVFKESENINQTNLETELIGVGETLPAKIKGEGYGAQELLEVHNP